jgi:hypothetical protein
MAKRGGKAASRRSRQRRAQRQQPSTQAQTSPSRSVLPADIEELREGDVTPSTDAFEKADAELRASTPPPGSRAEPAVRGATRPRPQPRDYASTSGPSRLSERAVAEYHYVGRDLRNIGVLSVILAVLLALSAVVVNLLGIGAA